MRLSLESDTPRPKRFSMIREFHVADWFTLANAICGTGAVLTSMTYLETGDVSRLYLASGAILAALVFDVLDGRIARWRQTSSRSCMPEAKCSSATPVPFATQK